MDLVIVTLPPWRVAMRRIDVLEGDWEMNEVQVEVVDSPVLKLLLRDRLNLMTSSSELDIESTAAVSHALSHEMCSITVGTHDIKRNFPTPE
jgi:hypothetical protein